MTDFTRIQLRRDTAADWTSANPILAEGEVGFEIDTGRSKEGDGTTAWNSLFYSDFWGANALVDGVTIPSDWEDGSIHTVTLAGNRTLSNPTNIIVGRPVYYLITQDTTGNRTLAFGSYFSLNGEKISNEAGAVTVIKAIALSATSIQCYMDSNVSVDFETVNLKFDVASNTTVTITADKVAFVNKAGEKLVQSNFSATANIATHITGTEYASTWYNTHIDSAGTIKMLPNLEGTADTNTLNSLEDSGATFSTDGVTAGSAVYNTTDLTSGYVGAVSSEVLLTIVDAAGAALDLFPLGTEDYKIVTKRPAGLGEFTFNPGAAFNNAASHLDDSTYTQIQEEESYSEAAGDFTITGPAGISVTEGTIFVSQINDWTGKGQWEIDYHAHVNHNANQNPDLTTSGVVFKTGIVQPALISFSHYTFATSVSPALIAQGGNGILSAFTGSISTSSTRLSIIALLDKKPTFHT